MKQFVKLFAPLVGCAVLTACSSGEIAQVSQADPAGEAAQSESYTLGEMPVLAIETAEQGDAALDFVTRPVDAYVASEMAKWTPDFTMPPEPYYVNCAVTLTDTDQSVYVDHAAAEVKVRGNWTTMYEKKPLRIKFEENQNMLGLHEGIPMKNWVLLAEYKDFSMLRNRSALYMADEILGAEGYYASDARLVEVTINGQYWGVYLLAELQQVNKHRVTVTEPKKEDTSPYTGYFMEYDGYYLNEADPLLRFRVDYDAEGMLVPFDGTDTAQPMTVLGTDQLDVGITIGSKIRSQEQHDFIERYMQNVYAILYRAAYAQEAYVFNADYTAIEKTDSLTPQEAAAQAVDLASLADSYILCELTCDADIYWSSFFMDVDFGEGGSRKLTFEAPWDFDSALGNKDRCADAAGFYAANVVSDVNDQTKMINPWLAVLMHTDWFRQMVRARWDALYAGGLFDRTAALIDSESTQYAPAFARNITRWGDLSTNGSVDEMCAAARACKTQAEAAAYLRDWLTKRVAFLQENL